MRKFLNRKVFYFSFFLLVGCGGQSDVARLMSYNIRNGIGMDDVRDLQRLANVISACDPDVVAVQEIDSMTARSGQRDVLVELATLTGMTPIYAPAIDFDGGKYGVGMLCKAIPLSVYRIPLPGREERRMLLLAEFNDYVFACTHLSLTEADRMLSLPLIEEAAKKIPGKPFFLAGDFNAEPAEPFIRTLSEQFTILTDTTQRTFPADVPDCTIDYIVKLGVGDKKAVKMDVASAIKAEEVSIASDHRPVFIDISYKKK